MSTKRTQQETYDSLTGFDEIAIEKTWSIDIHTTNQSKPGSWIRALVFIELRRDGRSDVEAKTEVMSMGIGACNEFFEPEPEEVDPEDPATDAGKGSSSPAVELNDSPTFVRGPE